MNQLFTAILTAGITLIAGIVLLSVGEGLKVLVFIPLTKYREHAQLTVDRVDFYANKLTNFFPDNPSPETLREMSNITSDLRSGATGLSSLYASIGCARLLTWLRIIPLRRDIDAAYSELMYLSVSLLTASEADQHNNTRINGRKIAEVQRLLR